MDRELSHKHSHTWTREEPQRREAQREDGNTRSSSQVMSAPETNNESFLRASRGRATY